MSSVLNMGNNKGTAGGCVSPTMDMIDFWYLVESIMQQTESRK